MLKRFAICALALAVGAAYAAPQTAKTDVLVIGAGAAGLTAAIEAHDAGAEVLVVDKMIMAGGNTVRAVDGMNACCTDIQKAKEIHDSEDAMVSDTMRSANWKLDTSRVRILAHESGPAVNWLAKLGADLRDVSQLPGSSVPRSHRPTDGSFVGPEVMRTLLDAAEARKIEIRTNTQARRLVLNDAGAVVGARVKNEDGVYQIDADAVVLATGGFAADNDMVVAYAPQLKGFGSTNHPGATGDGLRLAETAGAALVDMNDVETHPTVNTRTGEMVTAALRTKGAILVNADGKRFVDETDSNETVSNAILRQKDGKAWLVFDESIKAPVVAAHDYAKEPYALSAKDFKTLALDMEVPPKALQATIDAWRRDRETGEDAFGRRTMPLPIDVAPFWAIEVRPSVHHTSGGVKIDAEARALTPQGTPVPGLFAAGEVTGGLHGGNRIEGNALADVVIFGRIAGKDAAEWAKTH